MKKTNITLSIALAAVFSASTAFAEAEVTGKIIHESAKFTSAGIGIGAATTQIQTADSHGKDVMKTETSARIFIDGDAEELHEGSTYHVELNLMRDSKGVGKYDGNESYTQRDALREAYVDAEVNDWSIRAGKQQVVWGTADGMKLLDTINPTDYSEMAQNQMEDSRIPVWMLNAETQTEDGKSYQVVVSEAKSHKIAGIGIGSGAALSHTNGNAGNAFIMKGVDTITGKVNGFLNIAPALGGVAGYFVGAGADTSGDGSADNYQGLYDNWKGATVHDFTHDSNSANNFSVLCGSEGTGANTAGTSGTTVTSAACLGSVANSSGSNPNSDVTNLTSGWATAAGVTGATATSESAPVNTFDLMPNATFATFFSFRDLKSKYVVDHGNNANIALKMKDATASGLNYSLNYLYHDDSNPNVNIHWEDTSGNRLTTDYVETTSHSSSATTTHTTVRLLDADGSQHLTGDNDASSGLTDGQAEGRAILVFEEKLNRVHSLGGSFDTAIETASIGPVVIRGEALYEKDVMSPIVSKAALSIGDLEQGLKMQKGDVFRYVLGADITALTNMMVSAQFIQIRDLDYIDETHTPSANGTASSVSGARYTSDRAAMHLSNSLQKAEKNKEFYSLFLSKPFGASGEHRWNNIFMFEENGGKWNRLDAEFSIDDDTQATVEYNKYWGDANTQFGQLEKSSNIQVGVKYSF